MTNREYLNSLTDEEFVKWAHTDFGVYDDMYCEKCHKKEYCVDCDQLDNDALLWWLKQEFATKTE